jgi:hypothetical protein
MNKFLVACLITLSSCTSAQHKRQFYTVDKTVESRVEKEIEQYNRKGNANIYFKLYENGDLVAQGDSDGESGLTFTTFVDDAIGINCSNGVDNGYGFAMVLSNDTSFIKFVASSLTGGFLFKLQEQDAPQPEITVNCTNYSATLAGEPTGKKDQIVAGEVQLRSQPFIEINGDKQRTISFELHVYFKSEPLPVINHQYKTLTK